jgi:hypothetical protein
MKIAHIIGLNIKLAIISLAVIQRSTDTALSPTPNVMIDTYQGASTKIEMVLRV